MRSSRMLAEMARRHDGAVVDAYRGARRGRVCAVKLRKHAVSSASVHVTAAAASKDGSSAAAWTVSQVGRHNTRKHDAVMVLFRLCVQ